MNKPLFSEILKAIRQNLLLAILLRLSRRPILAVSYEKALLFPEDFVTALCAFLGIHDKSKQAAALEFIKPSPPEYLKRATTCSQLDATGQWFGYVDVLEAHRIAGWALSTLDRKPLTIELLLQGARVQTATADLPRPDVAQVDARFPENCGFEFKLTGQAVLHEGDKIEVKIAGQALDLVNSPAVF
jgi:hypothetical protein